MIKAKDDKTIVSLLKNIDVLIDGRFVLKLKTDKCIYRGSSNQRIIDVDQSFKKKKVVLFKI
jgi:anaerobic ribonucleoside-triphosphate reductase activating protein